MLNSEKNLKKYTAYYQVIGLPKKKKFRRKIYIKKKFCWKMNLSLLIYYYFVTHKKSIIIYYHVEGNR